MEHPAGASCTAWPRCSGELSADYSGRWARTSASSASPPAADHPHRLVHRPRRSLGEEMADGLADGRLVWSSTSTPGTCCTSSHSCPRASPSRTRAVLARYTSIRAVGSIDTYKSLTTLGLSLAIVLVRCMDVNTDMDFAAVCWSFLWSLLLFVEPCCYSLSLVVVIRRASLLPPLLLFCSVPPICVRVVRRYIQGPKQNGSRNIQLT